MRELTVIPLVHMPFGLWKPERLERCFGKSPDPETVRRIVEGDRSYWDEVDRYLDSTRFDKVYQEASEVERSVEEFLEGFGRYKGRDRNVDAFFRLLDKGVEFVRTESTYARNESTRRRIYEEPDELEPIDSFIAQNIHDTLPDGQRGVLFLGVDHNVDNILKERYSQIEVERFHRDPSYLLGLLNSITVRR